MPTKIKVAWVLSCIVIFVGFVVLSNKQQMDLHNEKRMTEVEQAQKRGEEAKKRLEKESRFAEMMGQVKELMALGKYDEAAEKASNALVLNPKNARAHTVWGRALAGAGQIKEALDKFNLSSQLDPNQSLNYYYWGVTLFLKDD